MKLRESAITVIACAVFLFFTNSLVAQTTDMNVKFNQHAPEELGKFAFWVGLWEFETATTTADGQTKTVTGTNEITVTFDGFGLHENFNMGSGENQFSGGSVTCFDPKKKEFVQVWVDNSGWHKTFIGGWNEEEQAMILYGPEEEREGNPHQRRLVWKSITADTMEWNYDLSTDGGESWKTTWVLNYKRVKE